MSVGQKVHKKQKKLSENFVLRKNNYLCSPKADNNSPVAVFETSSGCSSARLEYTSGGRGVASSNLVTPTKQSKSLQSQDWRLLYYKALSCLHERGLCNTKVPCSARVGFCFVWEPPLRSPSEEPPCVAHNEVI